MGGINEIRLCAIYNVWFDAIEHLEKSISLISEHTDKIIIIMQYDSNRGETLFNFEKATYDKILHDIQKKYLTEIIEYIPDLKRSAANNERAKRSLGLRAAKSNNCTHFFHIDSDEYWIGFKEAKQKYIDSKAKGSVCKMYTYFKHAYLRLEEPETYHVPFIHELRENTTTGIGRYPFYVDPTRKINEENVVELDHYMHHMSYVRLDIRRKMRNSSAVFEEDNQHLKDYNRELKAGDFIECFKQKLVEIRT